VEYKQAKRFNSGEKHQYSSQISVINSTANWGVVSPIWPASIVIPAKGADKQVMERHLVEKEVEGEVFGMRPRYLCHNLWSPDADPMITAVEWTLSALLLPRPPVSEYENIAACRTVTEYPDLFKIIMPIKISALDYLLKSHPNHAFVDLVPDGLCDGFWTWASTVMEGYPVMLDESKTICLMPEKEEFLERQLKHEEELERVSPEFGEVLLPGMYCMPTYLVPKPQSIDWRLVNNLSARLFSLNSMVDCCRITRYPLDNLSQLGLLMMKKHHLNPNKCLVVWKLDIAEAYRTCPMHKLWQLKQAIRINGRLRIDKVNVFGGLASGAIFISLNALLAWAAKYEMSVEDLIYVDDSFGVEEESRMMEYEPYGEKFLVCC